MSFQAQLVMILWLPIVLFLFDRLPSRKAVIISVLIGFLFLPQGAGFDIPFIPDYRGNSATFYSVFLGILLYDRTIFQSFKPSWIDIPALLFSIAPLFSSLSNDLGFYDGFNQSLGQTAVWGSPYLLGRLYFGNLKALTELAIYIVKGGLLYVPLCLYEVRMSPQLHRMVYGYFPHSFAQTRRFDGWRPQVFLQHGLSVGLFMMAATLIAIWLWQGNVVKKIWGIKIEWVCLIMIVTFILIKSTGAYLLMIIGLSILFSAKLFKTNIVLCLVMLGMIIYLAIAVSGNFNGDDIITFLIGKLPDERLQSLQTRFDNEELLVQKAQLKMLFGWGGWGRSRIYGENWEGIWEDISITDSFWIIIFGVNGLFGLINYHLMMLVPVFLISFLYPARMWLQPQLSGVMALGVCSVLSVADNLVNYMFNPLFPLIVGGFSGLVMTSAISFKRRQIKTINPLSAYEIK